MAKPMEIFFHMGKKFNKTIFYKTRHLPYNSSLIAILWLERGAYTHSIPPPISPQQDRQTFYILVAETVIQAYNPSPSILPHQVTHNKVNSYSALFHVWWRAFRPCAPTTARSSHDYSPGAVRTQPFQHHKQAHHQGVGQRNRAWLVANNNCGGSLPSWRRRESIKGCHGLSGLSSFCLPNHADPFHFVLYVTGLDDRDDRNTHTLHHAKSLHPWHPMGKLRTAHRHRNPLPAHATMPGPQHPLPHASLALPTQPMALSTSHTFYNPILLLLPHLKN